VSPAIPPADSPVPPVAPSAPPAPEGPVEVPPPDTGFSAVKEDPKPVPEPFAFTGIGRAFIFSIPSPVLRWKKIPENKKIRVQLASDDKFSASSLLVDETVEYSFFALPAALTPETVYYLRGAREEGSESSWTRVLLIGYRPFKLPPDFVLPISKGSAPVSFTMGYSKGLARETPEHKVTLTREFFLGKTEVTNREFSEVMNRLLETEAAELRPEGVFGVYGLPYLGLGNLNYGFQFGLVSEKGRLKPAAGRENHPASGVSWYGALVFCNTLSLMEGREPVYDEVGTPTFAADGYRLPTEAEWEFAARGERGLLFPTGAALDPRSANYHRSGDPFDYIYGNPTVNGGPTTPAGYYNGSLRAGYRTVKGSGPFGHMDLLGNVWEWAWDPFDAEYYAGSPESDPVGPETGEFRVLRGGAWNTPGPDLRLSARGWYRPEDLSYSVGFRVARSGPQAAATVSK
jgi:formylglycine-generating enzyme required for sulfatase activity